MVGRLFRIGVDRLRIEFPSLEDFGITRNWCARTDAHAHWVISRRFFCRACPGIVAGSREAQESHGTTRHRHMSSHDVFISYARGTARTEARALRDALDGRGRKVFLDEGEIPYGSEIPGDVAAGLVGSRVAVVFLDDRYLTRPFCIYELQVITALARSAGLDANGGTRHVVVAFPASGSGDLLVPYLPPSIANRSWPTATQTNDLASMIEERLLEGRPPLGELLRDVADDAVRRLRAGGQIPLPWAPADGARGAPPLGFVSDIPDSRGDGFVGREHDLWRVFDALVTPRAFGTPLGCTVYGPGGCGKSQLAAEFALRYGRR